MRHKRGVALGFLALVFVDSLQLTIPKLIQYVVDGLAEGAATATALWLVVGGIVAASFGIACARLMWRYYLVGASHKIERELRQDLYDHLQTLPAPFYDHTKVGDIMAHASNDITAVRMATGIAALAAFDEAERKILQVVKRQNEIALDQLGQAQRHLFPLGRPQERSLNAFYYLTRYGPELVSSLLSEFDVALGTHSA